LLAWSHFLVRLGNNSGSSATDEKVPLSLSGKL
jgi:hypothetical protein